MRQWKREQLLVLVMLFTGLALWMGSPALYAQSGENSGEDEAQKAEDQQTDGDGKESFSEQTPKSREAVQKAVDWLAKTQNADGSWGGEPNQSGDLAVTSAVCLALVARGNTPRRGSHASELRQGLSYILKKSEKWKPIEAGSSRTKLMQRKLGKHIHTFMTATLLGQLSGTTFRPVTSESQMDQVQMRLKDTVEAIENYQNQNGGWEVKSFSIGLTTASAWLSLRSANSAGLSVDASLDGVVNYITKQGSDFSKNTNTGDPKGFYNAAAVIRILYGSGKGNSKLAKKATKQLMEMVDTGKFGRYSFDENRVGGEEYYAALLATQGLFHTRDTRWEKWYQFIRNTLVKLQNADGSWNGHHCITYRTFCTAVNVINLSIPNRLLPIQQK